MEALAEGLRRAIERLRGAPVVDERTLNEFVRDVQRALLRADVSVDLVLGLSKRIRERVKKEELPPGFSKRELLLRILYEELISLLGGEKPPVRLEPRKKPFVIMLVGIQGSGKTTTAAKLAYYYSRKGFKVGLVCADNYRPAAAEQLRQLAEQAGVAFYADRDRTSSIAMAKRGVEHFASRGFDVIIIDTAGRHKSEKGLLEEMGEMYEALKPDQVVLVIDATMGKQAGPQAEAFHKAAPLGSIIVTKLDGAAKGGGALAATARTGAPIVFVGTGEKIDELEPFDPPSFVNRLLGMGDLKALVDKFRAVEAAAKIRVESLATGRITLLDLKEQLEAISKMGPLKKILELLPGAYKLPGVENVAEENIRKWLAIMNSMTRAELLRPEIIDKSRVIRIARGSGTSPQDVKALLSSYRKLRKVYKRLIKQQKRLGRGIGLPYA